MAYRLPHEVWIQRQVERCRGVLIQHMEPARDYTLGELLILCADLGLVYSNPEYQEIGQRLLTEGFLEQV